MRRGDEGRPGRETPAQSRPSWWFGPWRLMHVHEGRCLPFGQLGVGPALAAPPSPTREPQTYGADPRRPKVSNPCSPGLRHVSGSIGKNCQPPTAIADMGRQGSASTPGCRPLRGTDAVNAVRYHTDHNQGRFLRGSPSRPHERAVPQKPLTYTPDLDACESLSWLCEALAE